MTHRFTLLSFVFLVTVSNLWAQATYTASSFPTAGDVLPVATAKDSTLTIQAASSTAIAWDFSRLQPTNQRVDTIRAASTGGSFGLFPNADILGPLIGGVGTAYTDVTATQIVTIGGGVEVFGLSFAAPYTDPHVRQIVPLTYNDNATDQYALSYSNHVDSIPFLRQLIDSLTAASPIPVNPDSIRLTLTGDETRIVDAWGTCLLPDSALYEVLRQKVTTDFEVSIEIGSQVPFFGFRWVNLSTFASLPFPTRGRVVQYNFLADGIPQPVVSLTMDSAGTAIINIEYVDSTYRDQDIAVNRLPNALPVLLYPNPAHEALYVQLPVAALPASGATLTLCNALGQPVWTRSAVRDNRVTVEVAGLPKGAYILTVTTNDNGYAELRATKQVLLH